MKRLKKILKIWVLFTQLKDPNIPNWVSTFHFKNIMQKWGLNRWNTCSPWGWVRIEFFLKVGSWIKLLHKYYIVATVFEFCLCLCHTSTWPRIQHSSTNICLFSFQHFCSVNSILMQPLISSQGKFSKFYLVNFLIRVFYLAASPKQPLLSFVIQCCQNVIQNVLLPSFHSSIRVSIFYIT